MKTKHFLLCAIAVSSLMLGSCTTTKFYQSVGFLDYSEYTKDGFFLTELASVPFDYDAVGSMSVTEHPGVQRDYDKNEKEKEWYFEDGIYVKSRKDDKKNWRSANVYSCLDALVAKAKTVGGSGVVDLKIVFGKNRKGELDGSLTVSGMVIKRK